MERLLRARDVAELLGMSTDWVLKQWQKGGLPGYRLPSGSVRFRESELEAWLQSHRKNAAQPDQRSADHSA